MHHFNCAPQAYASLVLSKEQIEKEKNQTYLIRCHHKTILWKRLTCLVRAHTHTCCGTWFWQKKSKNRSFQRKFRCEDSHHLIFYNDISSIYLPIILFMQESHKLSSKYVKYFRTNATIYEYVNICIYFSHLFCYNLTI